MPNPYTYTSEADVRKHLGEDLSKIYVHIIENGYVCEQQFSKLDTYLCENYASIIMRILSEELDREILYAFSSGSCFFSFYDSSRLTFEEVNELADKFSEMLGY